MPRRPTTLRSAVAALLAAGLLAATLAACADEADEGLPLGPGGQRVDAPIERTGSLPGGTRWRLRAPERDAWNGTLLLYSRGSVPPGEENAALDAPDESTARLLLEQGFAMVGSSYREPGWVLDTAVDDQHRLLDVAAEALGRPERVVAWGHSLGGLVTIALAEQHPEDLDGAMAACGVVGGPDLVWDPFLDVAFVLRTLLLPADARIQLAGFTTPPRLALQQLLDAGQEAFETAEGRARVALVAAVAAVPGTGAAPTPPAGAAGELERELGAQATNLAFILPMATTFRAHMEARVGGNPSSNTEVDHAALLAASPTRALVEQAYAAAGLDLADDLARLALAPRVPADPSARRRLLEPADPTGALTIPAMVLHSPGDGIALPSHVRDYADKVAAAGRGDLLRTAAVDRPGHCLFTAAEQVAALAALLERVDTGAWPDLSPSGLTAAATAFGPDANVQTAPDGTTTPTDPAFVTPAFPPAPRTAALRR